MITEKGLNIIANSILNLIDHAEIKIDDEVKKLNLYKTSIEKNYLKVFLMLDDTVRGKIKETNLLSKSNEILMSRCEIIDKDISKGLLIIFSIKINEVDI